MLVLFCAMYVPVRGMQEIGSEHHNNISHCWLVVEFASFGGAWPDRCMVWAAAVAAMAVSLAQAQVYCTAACTPVPRLSHGFPGGRLQPATTHISISAAQ